MTAENETPPNFRLCAAVSKAAGDDPCGSGTPFDGYLGIKVTPPWKRNVTESVRFPDELCDAVERLQDAGIVGKLTGLVPDGLFGAYEALVEASGSVMTLASSGTDPLEEATRYRVSRLEKTT